MINLPLSELIKHITAQANITPEEVTTRIKKKLSELSGLISEEGAAHIVANELGVTFEQPEQTLTIDKIQAGMRGLEVIGKVKQIYEVREFNSARGPGKVGNFLLMDTTGTTRIVLWNDHTDYLKELEIGDIIRLKNTYARKNQERVELHLGHDAKLERNPEGVAVDVDVTALVNTAGATKKISELTAEDQNVSVIATIVQLFEPRFFSVCPECNSRAREEEGVYTCANHGIVEPSYNYVMNLFLDDGTDNTRCVLWRAQVESLLGKTKEELIAMKDDPGAFESYKSDLLGVIVKARGKVQNNTNFGQLELVAYELEKNVEPEIELAEIKKESDATPVTDVKEEVVVKEEVTAIVEDEKVESITVKKETTIKAETPITADAGEDEMFTLDDLEDLEDLEE